MKPVPIELEAKVALADPAPLRATLSGLGIPASASFQEDNLFFDLPGDTLRRGDCTLRLRTETPLGERGAGRRSVHRLTHKGARDAAAGHAGLKARPEAEAVVVDPSDTEAVLLALGYARRFRFQKRRDRYLLGGCRVEIDELPSLGHFVEVEGPDADSIDAAIAKLGLAEAPRETRGYLGLLLAGGVPTGPTDGPDGPSYLFDL